MRVPTIHQVLELHEDVVNRSGGAPGLRSMSALESALAQPQMAFQGRDLYPSLAKKGAALCFSIVKNHPFLDGNKRVGYAAMETFLLMNGSELDASVDEAERVMHGLASGNVTREQLNDWVGNHIRKLGPQAGPLET